MDQLITQVGVGGVIALLVIREVLNYLKGRNGTNDKNENIECVRRKEFEDHKKAVRYTDTCDKVHEGIQRQFNHLNDSLNRIEKLIRNGHGE
jgi:hypothetical protein